jgi:hypothetical protein
MASMAAVVLRGCVFDVLRNQKQRQQPLKQAQDRQCECAHLVKRILSTCQNGMTMVCFGWPRVANEPREFISRALETNSDNDRQAPKQHSRDQLTKDLKPDCLFSRQRCLPPEGGNTNEANSHISADDADHSFLLAGIHMDEIPSKMEAFAMLTH